MRHKPGMSRQRGAALLILMLMVIIATASVLLVNLNRDDLRTRRLTDTRSLLGVAKEALIEYAVLNPDLHPGQSIGLPCPDIDGSGGYVEGESHSDDCGATGETVIGRLPWRTLEIPALRDSESACLWYVVSGSFKNAGTETAAMINADSNGQLQFANLDTGDIVEGLLPSGRPVAMVIAAMRPVAGQTRPAAAADTQCSTSYDAAEFLESEAATGISNAALSGVVDDIDVLGSFSGLIGNHNDRIVTISRAEVARRLYRRPDFEVRMRTLGIAVAKCVADYAAGNPGGNNDQRMPWPATVDLADYRDDADYDDADNGDYSGRLPDIVDDSNGETGNTIARVLSDCDPAQVPEWSAFNQALWQHWKDHFFYAVAGSYAPTAGLPTECGDCLSVNGAGEYAAIVMFSNERLPSLGQVRDAPPIDSDTRDDALNYLEGSNAVNVTGSAPSADYLSQPALSSFNDLLFCIEGDLVVSEC